MKNKKGISIIVLIVTIIVIIILGTIVILTLNNSNLIESAKESTFKDDIRTFQDDLSLRIAKEYTDKQGQRDEKINASGEDVKKYIPSFTDKYLNKFAIVDDKLVGTDKLDNKETVWAESLNITINKINYNDIADWEYSIDETNNNVILNKYIGSSTYLAIPDSYTIDGKVYTVSLSSVSLGSYCGWGYKFTGPFADCTDNNTYTGNALNLETVILDNKMQAISPYLFYGCKNLKEVKINSSITSIENNAFCNCSSLTSIVMPDKVTNIGNKAFYNCSSLINITMPTNLEFIGNGCFDGTAWYNNFPDGIIYIENILYKYKGKDNMPKDSAINIKEGTKIISGEAFFQCYYIQSITIPNTVKNIGDGAFMFCQFSNITFNGTVEEWNDIKKDSNWNANSSLKTVTCTDGIVSL